MNTLCTYVDKTDTVKRMKRKLGILALVYYPKTMVFQVRNSPNIQVC